MMIIMMLIMMVLHKQDNDNDDNKYNYIITEDYEGLGEGREVMVKKILVIRDEPMTYKML